MTAGEVMQELEAAGVVLWLDGDRVRYRRGRGRVSRTLLAAAGEHRDAIRRYLARRCEQCGSSGSVMVMLDSDSPWWLCPHCWSQR